MGIWAHEMKQLSNPTEAFIVDEQMNVEHDGQSNSVLCNGVDSRTTVSPGLYLLDCGELLLQLSSRKGCCFVNELVSVFQRAVCHIQNSLKVLKTQKHSGQIISWRSSADLKNAGFAQ